MTPDQRRTFLLAAVGVTHGSLDLVTTHWALSLTGRSSEANPVMRAVLTNAPGWAFHVTVFTGIAVIAACVFCIDHVYGYQRVGTGVLSALTVAGCLLVANNLAWVVVAA